MTLCLAFACSSDLAVSPTDQPPSTATRVPAIASSDEAGLTTAFAQALREPAARAELHLALRRSPYAYHKVSVQQLLGSDDGRTLLDGVAAAMRLAPAAALARIEALPALEMLLPARQDRLGWRSGDQLAVFASVSRATRATRGMSTKGDAVALATALSPSYATLLIRPSRGLTLRFNPQPDRPSSAVQDPDDGEMGVRTITYKSNGDSVERQLARYAHFDKRTGTLSSDAAVMMVACDDSSCSSGGGGGTIPPDYGPPVRIGMFDLVDVKDNGLLWDTNEFRFEAWMSVSGVQVEHSVTYLDGIDANAGFSNLALPILHGSPSSFGNSITAWLLLYEEDGTWNGRDEYYNGAITSADNSYARGTMGYPHFRGGADRCGWIKGGQAYNCPWVDPIDGSVVYWKEVNFNTYWVR
jgi:hypothetical protein